MFFKDLCAKVCVSLQSPSTEILRAHFKDPCVKIWPVPLNRIIARIL